MGDSQAGGISKLLQAETLAQEIVNRARKGTPSRRGSEAMCTQTGACGDSVLLSWMCMVAIQRRRLLVGAALGWPRRRGACSKPGA